MINSLTGILRAVTRKQDEPLNILCAPTHERIETEIAKSGHNFYAFQHDSFKGWNTNYAPVPENYVLLNKALGNNQLPLEVEFDLVLSQNKFGQFQILSQLSKALHVPLISLEHTLPHPGWPKQQVEACREMRGNLNIFISDYSIKEWKWTDRKDTAVIRHGIDTTLFNVLQLPREPIIFSVVNDWINRDWCCNFQGWRRIVKDLPVFVYGDTKGLSVPAPSTEALVDRYNRSRIFLNTSTISPVPTSLLEAMACGCACVSTATCMIPEVIQHGENGLISNNEKDLREFCELLLKDEKLAHKLGSAARRTIVEKFNEERFLDDWARIFNRAKDIVYTGV